MQIKAVFVPHEFNRPLSPHTSTAFVVQWLPHKANASTSSMVLPPFLTVILFVWCGQRIQHIAILIPLKLHCGSKELCNPTHKQKDATLQPPPPFRLCQYKNWRKLLKHNVALCVRFRTAFCYRLCKHPTAQSSHIRTLC